MKANDELTQLAVEKEKARIQMAEKEAQLKESKEQAKAERGLAETGFDVTLLPGDLDAASADVQDLARSGAYRRVDQILNPESMASQAYQTAVERQTALDQRRRKEYLEKSDPRALEREEKILSSPKQLEKRYREMNKIFPKYTDFTDEYIDEIFASQGIKDPTQYGTYDQLRNFFETEEKKEIDKIKQSYFADSFRLEKAGGGLANLTRTVAPDSGPMSRGLSYLYNRARRK
jgi:hypothetical protein